MKNYALSLANYFIRLSRADGKDIRPLKLMKLVYIAHGYILAILDRPTDGAKLENVEAWQYGPVFPSVYYSFKMYGSNPIEHETTVFDFDRIGVSEDIEFTPMLMNDEEKTVCRFVWETYGIYSDSSLVSILHADGSPWKKNYVAGRNNIIPDSITKKYYRDVIKETLKKK